jgi:hypothetical protein
MGWNILTGADRDRIIEAVRTFKAPSEHPPQKALSPEIQ